MSTTLPNNSKIWGELYLDENDNTHFVCHTLDNDFIKTRETLIKFIEILQNQIDNQQKCPFYKI